MNRIEHIHCAKVLLAQSRHFTIWARGFSFVLLEWAAQQRRMAAQNHIVELNKTIGQMDLFS